jgi:hypothetical protein
MIQNSRSRSSLGFWQILWYFLLFVLNVPVWIYKVQYNIESINDPKIYAAGIAILLFGFKVMLLSENFEIRSVSSKDLFVFRTLMIIGFIICSILDYFHVYEPAIILMSLLFVMILCFLCMLDSYNNARERFGELFPARFFSLIILIAGIFYFQYLNFMWMMSSTLVIVNVILLILNFIIFKNNPPGSPRPVSQKELDGPVKRKMKKLDAEIKPLMIIFFLFETLGMIIGLEFSLFKLISENLPFNHQTMVFALTTVLFCSIWVISSEKLQYKLLATKYLPLLLLILFLIIVGFPWIMVTTDRLNDSIAGMMHFIGVYLNMIILFLIMGHLIINSENEKIMEIMSRTASWGLAFGFALGLAGYFFGGMNYRVGPEIAIAYILLMTAGLISLYYFLKMKEVAK